jgi:tetratricopeptide (TPR) repeat protein
MSVEPAHLPTPDGGFVHPLLRARDWQDRPEFGELRQWWMDGGIGVCALVGIGGAGKTAIAERFLQVLPGGYPEHPKVPKDRNLPAPARLFVFSFYDAPNPDKFFTELAAWLEGRLSTPAKDAAADPGTRPPSYRRTLDLLAGAGKCLLVLDGLERAQDDGSRGGAFGQVLDGRLRDFVLRAADGYLPGVSVVITSRFRLFDPLASRVWYYRQIGVEKLQPAAAVHLLRDRGVHGTDEQLEDVAHEQGFHALSVDLVGGYIARFCGGDPQRFSSLTPELADVADVALDPRIAAIREQERKFAHLAEQYHLALAQSDPGTLALLQRICLFRLGVDVKTLTAIFTGNGKESISGPELACLNEQQLHSKLQLLVEMRLVEASKLQTSEQTSQIYTVHPAVRDGFLNKLDSETARLGHDAAREGLETSLGGQPSDNPSDPATLDLLEEIVYHTLAAGHAQEAFDIYWYRIGNYKNLGWRLGAYERGERICRAFAAGQPPQAASLSAGLSEYYQAVIINERVLYLKQLGQLAAAIRLYERPIEAVVKQEDWRNASTGNQNLASIFFLAGRLTAGLSAAEKSLQCAERAVNEKQARNSHICRGFALSMCGYPDKALADFKTALLLQNTIEPSGADQLLWSFRSIQHGLVLAQLGRYQEAIRLTKQTIDTQIAELGSSFNIPKGKLLLADLARARGDLAMARVLLKEAHEWALRRDAKESLCWSALVQAEIELSAFVEHRFASKVATSLVRAASALEEGLRIARDCGFGIYHIDLLLVRAQLALHDGRADDAERDVRVALDEGVHPSAESGFPELLAATDPECLYAWGIVEGRHLLAEALLLQAAQKLGQVEFAPKRLDRLPAEVQDLIGRAREQLDQALELWRQLRDPESEADINPRGERTRRVIEQLDGGILTEYPLAPQTTETPEKPAKSREAAPEAKERIKKVSKKQVFLSYCRDNKAEVAKLRDDLIAAGEPVWWDQDILAGQDWKLEIRKAMRSAYAVVLCLSEETADRITSGIYPEVLDAIDAYRQYAPGSVFLIPVRLSDCEIPLIEIDGTRTLERLQFVDLFPVAQRAAGLGRLVQSLQAAEHHP